MSDTHHDPHPRPHSAALAGSYLECDLPAEIHRLRAETTWSTGHNARTLIKYDDLRVVLIALQRNASIPGRTFSLRPWGMVALDRGVPHDVEAMEESAFLLTISWPGAQ